MAARHGGGRRIWNLGRSWASSMASNATPSIAGRLLAIDRASDLSLSWVQVIIQSDAETVHLCRSRAPVPVWAVKLSHSSSIKASRRLPSVSEMSLPPVRAIDEPVPANVKSNVESLPDLFPGAPIAPQIRYQVPPQAAIQHPLASNCNRWLTARSECL